MATASLPAWHLYELLHELTDTHADANVVLGNDGNQLMILEDGKMIGFIDVYQKRITYYPEPVSVSIPAY